MAAMFARLLLLAIGFSSAAASAPNFIVIFADDLGYGDLGSYGAKDFETPNLDRMAAEGARFTDFYSASGVCTPARAALMTGCHQMRVGLGHRVLFPYTVEGLHPDEITIAEVLKTKGYATAAIGKWHLGHQKKFLPTRQGFDYYFGIPYSNDMGGHFYRREHYQAPPLPMMRMEQVIEQEPAQALLTKRYTREAINFIREHRDEPFFIYLPHSMPHLPIDASSDFKGKTKHGLYGDVIEELDWSVGQILAELKDSQLDDNTMVIFTSDNGPVTRPDTRQGFPRGSAGVLRGAKNSTWEGGMREPSIMRWPGKILAGTLVREMASTMDLMPTIAKLAGAEAPTDRVIDGKDIWPLISAQPGAKTPHEAFYYYRDERLQAVRSGQWKLHTYRPEWGDDSDHAPLLYDLAADLGEQNDVAAANAEVVRRLEALAEAARDDLGDALTRRIGKQVRPVGRL